MAEKFSAQWWNDQARAAGKLYKDDIERLTGMSFSTQWNPDGSIAVPWNIDVRNRAPGFATAGLLLGSDGEPPGYDPDNPPIGDPTHPKWIWFKSAVGTVAPGTTTAYQPTLSPSYTPPPPAPSQDTTTAALPPPPLSGAPSELPDTMPPSGLAVPVGDITPAVVVQDFRPEPPQPTTTAALPPATASAAPAVESPSRSMLPVIAGIAALILFVWVVNRA